MDILDILIIKIKKKLIVLIIIVLINVKKKKKKWIDSFFDDCKSITKTYISNSVKKAFLEKYKIIRKSLNFAIFDLEKVRLLKEIYDNFEYSRKYWNEQYISKELKKNKDYFDNIFKYPIDDEQRRAIVIDEDNQLIVAGAGSGKTTTIIGKTKYLIEKKGINPESIITISFTNAATDNFREKLGDSRVQCSTFHKLGKDIYDDGLEKHDIAPENYLREVTKEYFNDLIFNDDKRASELIEFYAYYLHHQNNEDIDFGTELEYNKGIDLETLRYKYQKNSLSLETLKEEKVKSLQELVIANFLFINNIQYEYEPKYKYNTANRDYRQYHPDFYLPEYDLYIEHFGINLEGRAPQYNEEEERKYLSGIDYKRRLHKKNGTKLLEIYSSDFYNFNIDEVLRKKLTDVGVELKQINKDILLSTINKISNEEMNSFYNLIGKFIKMFKGNNYSIEKFDEFIADAIENNNKRKYLLLDILREIFKLYQRRLVENEYIDFDDMINLATARVNQGYNKKISYIIIDEFQDISYSRYLLIKTLQEKTNAKIVAVGDDWQSIYRFSGCDLDLFVNFKKYFEEPELSYITNTYRNCQSLIDVSSSFIMKNKKGQIAKSIKSNKEDIQEPVEFIYYTTDIKNTTKKAIKELKDNGCKKIAILGRNNSDIKRYNLLPNLSVKEVNMDEIFGEGVVFTTIHKSKGLEYDGVIICNMDNYISGFPNKMSDDEILDYVSLTSDDYPFEEERRLMYVALTRTKTKCYCLIPKNESVFAEELRKIQPDKIKITLTDGNDLINRAKCPKCEKGYMVERYSKYGEFIFYGCTNYPGCDYIDRSKSKKNDLNYSSLSNLKKTSKYQYEEKYINREEPPWEKEARLYELGQRYGYDDEDRIRKPIIETLNFFPREEPPKDNKPKYYVDVIISGYESTFTYECDKDFKYQIGDLIYISTQTGYEEVKIATSVYQDISKDLRYFKKINILSKDELPVIEKREYIDVKFMVYSSESYRTYTYVCPKDFKYKIGDKIPVMNQYGLGKVVLKRGPYYDKTKDGKSFYKELPIFEED